MDTIDCELPIYTNLWFWLIALGVLFLAIGLIVWDVRTRLEQTWWIWLLVIGGAVLLVLGVVIALWQWWTRSRDRREYFEEELL